MNHEYISKFNLIDQYVLGKLPAAEIEEFEDHFVDCPACVEQLALARNFVHDLKGLAVQETLVREASRVPQTRRWNFQQLVPLRLGAAIACGLVLVVGLAAFFVVRRIGRLEAELHQAKADASAINQKYQQGLETTAESERRHQETQQDLTRRLDELEKQLKSEEVAGDRDQFANRGSGAPEVNFPIHSLVAVSRTGSPSPVEIALPASSSRFALSIPVQERQIFKSYRVIISKDGVTVFDKSGFKPDVYHALSLSLNSNYLLPGNYELRVEGLAESSQWTTVGSYPFSVARRR